MDFLQQKEGGMEVLSKEKMRQIVGAGNEGTLNNVIATCQYTCAGPRASYVVSAGTSCPDDFGNSCYNPEDEIVFCECDYE